MKTRCHFTYISLLLVLFVSGLSSVRAAEPAETVMLVATPKLGGGYGRTVLVAKRLAQESYIGVIINRPTRTSLATLFPEHEPSKKIMDPVYFGGPVGIDAVFAMVRTSQSPGEGSLQLAPDLFLVMQGEVIDRIIEQQTNEARFYFGVVVWQPGELAAELASGLWLVGPADTDLVLRKDTRGIWEELIQRLRARANLVSGRSGALRLRSLPVRPCSQAWLVCFEKIPKLNCLLPN
jgi:putative transcriptional regulator